MISVSDIGTIAAGILYLATSDVHNSINLEKFQRQDMTMVEGSRKIPYSERVK